MTIKQSIIPCCIILCMVGMFGVSQIVDNHNQFIEREQTREKIVNTTPEPNGSFDINNSYLWDVSVLKKSRVDRISIYMYVSDHRTGKPTWSSIISYKDIQGSSQQFNTHDQKSLKDTIVDINIFIKDVIPQLLKYTK